jgi:hypothetical protein
LFPWTILTLTAVSTWFGVVCGRLSPGWRILQQLQQVVGGVRFAESGKNFSTL